MLGWSIDPSAKNLQSFSSKLRLVAYAVNTYRPTHSRSMTEGNFLTHRAMREKAAWCHLMYLYLLQRRVGSDFELQFNTILRKQQACLQCTGDALQRNKS